MSFISNKLSLGTLAVSLLLFSACRQDDFQFSGNRSDLLLGDENRSGNDLTNSPTTPIIPVIVTPVVIEIKAPQNLTATARSTQIIDLSWTDMSDDESGFKIERATGAGAFVLVGTVSSNARGYSDNSNIQPDTFYTYRIYSYNSNSKSSYASSSLVKSLSCIYSLSASSTSPTAGATTGSVSLTTQGGCSWTARSNSSFVTLTSGASGTASGTINFSIAANSSTSSRTGTISIQNLVYSVTQAGVPPAPVCNYSLSTTAVTVNNTSSTGSVSLTTSTGCAWTVSNNSSFLTLASSANGTGSTSINYSVAANSNTSIRSGTLTIAGLVFTVVQNAAPQPTGTIYYVSSVNGSDSNPGTLQLPLKTITHAYNQYARAGVTIVVMPGTYLDYQANTGLYLNKSGTADRPIILKSQTRGGAVIDQQNNSNGNQAVYLTGSYNIIEGFEIKRGLKGGIAIYGSFNQIIGNEIHSNGTTKFTGIDGQDGVYDNPDTSNNIYIGNHIHGNGRAGSNLDHGLYLCGKNDQVYNNVITQNASHGMQIAGYKTVSNLKIHHNIIAMNGMDGITLWQTLNGIEIQNNIFYKNGQYGIRGWDAHGSGVVIDNNIVFENKDGSFALNMAGSNFTYQMARTVSADPKFKNLDFPCEVLEGSSAINAGRSPVANSQDFFGKPRSSTEFDIGACETDIVAGRTFYVAASGGNDNNLGSLVQTG